MIPNLKPCDGPPCPRCGCTESEILGSWEQWGTWRERRECGYCGQRWEAKGEGGDGATKRRRDEEKAPPAVPPAPNYEPKARCPKCGGRKTKVTSTRRLLGYRWHKCLSCAETFKSTTK